MIDPYRHAVSRRQLLAAGALGAGALAADTLLPGAASASARRRARLYARPDLTRPRPDQLEALRVLGRTTLRQPLSVPDASLPAGTDTMPEIEHVVVLMMENHSFDNIFGMLGRGPFQTARGDGFRIASDGYPANSNPQSSGKPLRAFHMPTTCQLSGKPTQEWEQAHIQYADGRNDGFVVSGSGDVAMGYWDASDLPFTYSLGQTFPIGDRYFCSVLGQTDPNRRYLIAATSCGMTDDVPDPSQDATFAATPKNGTIFTTLSDHGISWAEYDVQYKSTTSETMNLFADDVGYDETSHEQSINDFYADCKSGNLPSFSLVDPNFSTQSQENPQNITIGEAFLQSVVDAIGQGPKWQQTILIIDYDEHGGYYDHVPPPAALAPDDIGPVVNSGESTYDGFHRYGFRVPCVVVSPYAKKDYVSHIVYDHTSVLAFVEKKFNLPALTLRDANANDMTDFLDLSAMSAGKPTFPELPKLAENGDDAARRKCSSTGPGTIPPAKRPKPLPITVRLTYKGVSSKSRGAVFRLQASRPSLKDVTLELRRGKTVVARRRLGHVGETPRHVVLHVHGRVPPAGHYTAVVHHGDKTLARHPLTIH